MSARSLVLDAAGYEHLADIGKEPYEQKGIFNSEMAAVIAASLAMKVDVFIESGRARGHSTVLLARHLGTAGVTIHSFDRARDSDAAYAEAKLAGLPNLHLHYGDSRLAIPDFVAGLGNQRIALLIDGPKDKKAFNLLSDCLIRSDAIVVAFVHDLARLKDGAPSEGRVYAERWFEDPFFTDDAEFVDRYRHLDAPVFAATETGAGHWKPYHNGDGPQQSYGPTLGVFKPTERDRDAARKRGLSTSSVERLFFAVKDSWRGRRS